MMTAIDNVLLQCVYGFKLFTNLPPPHIQCTSHRNSRLVTSLLNHLGGKMQSLWCFRSKGAGDSIVLLSIEVLSLSLPVMCPIRVWSWAIRPPSKNTWQNQYFSYANFKVHKIKISFYMLHSRFIMNSFFFNQKSFHSFA